MTPDEIEDQQYKWGEARDMELDEEMRDAIKHDWHPRPEEVNN